jgi:hypothetical protein
VQDAFHIRRPFICKATGNIQTIHIPFIYAYRNYQMTNFIRRLSDPLAKFNVHAVLSDAFKLRRDKTRLKPDYETIKQYLIT